MWKENVKLRFAMFNSFIDPLDYLYSYTAHLYILCICKMGPLYVLS